MKNLLFLGAALAALIASPSGFAQPAASPAFLPDAPIPASSTATAAVAPMSGWKNGDVAVEPSHGFVFLRGDDAHSRHWTRGDKILEALCAGSITADFGETSDAVGTGEYREQNPILGPHPSQQRLNVYFLVAAGGQVGGALVMPRRYRRLWTLAWTGVEGGVVTHNVFNLNHK